MTQKRTFSLLLKKAFPCENVAHKKRIICKKISMHGKKEMRKLKCNENNNKDSNNHNDTLKQSNKMRRLKDEMFILLKCIINMNKTLYHFLREKICKIKHMR